MNSHRLVRILSVFLFCCAASAAFGQSAPASGDKRSELDVSAGRWVYHGHFLHAKDQRSAAWTWHEDCHWSANHVFMLCSFSNTWGGKHVNSVVVDTYDHQTDVFWHYEVFDSGDSAGKPFAAKMRIDGDTRVESWTRNHKGKSVHQRIVYKFVSGNKVTVSFQQSANGESWETTATGTGERLAAG